MPGDAFRPNFQWWSHVDYSMRLLDQHFARGVSEGDLHSHMYYEGHVFQPLKREYFESSGASEVIDDEDQFHVTLDLSTFTRRDISIAVVDNQVEITAHNNEKDDGFGLVERTSIRKYPIPSGVRSANVRCTFSDSGILTIHAPKDETDEYDVEIDEIPGL